MQASIRTSSLEAAYPDPVYDIRTGEVLNDAWDSAGKGAAVGAAAGTIVPGVGNAVGAAVGTVIGLGIGLFNNGPGAAEQNRIALREQLQVVGFNRKTGIYNNGKDDYNMGAYNVAQLLNLAQLYQQFPKKTVEYHNSGQMHKDTLNNVNYWADEFTSPLGAGFSPGIIGGGLMITALIGTGTYMFLKKEKKK